MISGTTAWRVTFKLLTARSAIGYLTKLVSAEIPCLSVYDSFIVPERYEDQLRAVMVKAFREVTKVNYDPPID